MDNFFNTSILIGIDFAISQTVLLAYCSKCGSSHIKYWPCSPLWHIGLFSSVTANQFASLFTACMLNVWNFCSLPIWRQQLHWVCRPPSWIPDSCYDTLFWQKVPLGVFNCKYDTFYIKIQTVHSYRKNCFFFSFTKLFQN